MEWLEYTSDWVKGEVTQGKIMVGIGLLLLVALVAIWRSDHDLLRGMMIPVGLLTVALIGYGGFQITGRPGHINKVQELYKSSPKQAFQAEVQKAEKDNNAYKRLKIVWAVLLVIAVGIYFFVSTEYLKGLSIGLMIMFLGVLILDSTLHYRLEIYKAGLEKYSSIYS